MPAPDDFVESHDIAASAAPWSRPAAAPLPDSGAVRSVRQFLAHADIELNGSRPWDLRIHDVRTLQRVLLSGNLGLGESYMDGWWDCDALDQFFDRVMRSGLDTQVGKSGIIWQAIRARLVNLQSSNRAWQVGQRHYDAGNDLFEAMLDSRMTYTCGYWAQADNLESAQRDKLDLICRKLELKPGMTLLDIGCGWGSLMNFAAEHYGVSCVGLTISREQVALGTAKAHPQVEFVLQDYRAFNLDQARSFDRIASVGMFEHVGHKNFGAFFDVVHRNLKSDGLCLLHTIGKRRRAGTGTDPFLDRYIFPNGALPSISQVVDAAEQRFVVEDLQNFGADYDRTLLAWNARFEHAWPQLAAHYDERFRRMWRYYLLSCAGSFRARDAQLLQFVLSPGGVRGGYRRVS
jgi:cyclopropane-fatty-acyl-phospholipid synthase